MKKFLVSALAMFVLVSFGSVFAQTIVDEEGHNVTVTIPNVAFLRFTPTLASNGVYSGDRNLIFAPSATEIEDGTPISQSNTNATWGDLKVFVNRTVNWTVSVDVAQDSGPEAFSWANIGAAGFDIVDDTIMTDDARGWTSLGFGANDFVLTPSDTMAAGTYVATVTYTLTIP